jgi:GxxExxY protein
MIKEEYKYSELTSKIIGCAMTVHSELGNGFQEVIYQRALEFEMSSQAINYLDANDLDSNKKIKVIQKSDESQFRQLQPRRSILPRQSEQ